MSVTSLPVDISGKEFGAARNQIPYYNSFPDKSDTASRKFETYVKEEFTARKSREYPAKDSGIYEKKTVTSLDSRKAGCPAPRSQEARLDEGTDTLPLTAGLECRSQEDVLDEPGGGEGNIFWQANVEVPLEQQHVDALLVKDEPLVPINILLNKVEERPEEKASSDSLPHISVFALQSALQAQSPELLQGIEPVSLSPQAEISVMENMPGSIQSDAKSFLHENKSASSTVTGMQFPAGQTFINGIDIEKSMLEMGNSQLDLSQEEMRLMSSLSLDPALHVTNPNGENILSSPAVKVQARNEREDLAAFNAQSIPVKNLQGTSETAINPPLVTRGEPAASATLKDMRPVGISSNIAAEMKISWQESRRPSQQPGLNTNASAFNTSVGGLDHYNSAMPAGMSDILSTQNSGEIMDELLLQGDMVESDGAYDSSLPFSHALETSHPKEASLNAPHARKEMPVAEPLRLSPLNFTPLQETKPGKLTLQLTPESMGKVEVTVHKAEDGRIDAVVQVERPETYDLFRRDQQELQRVIAEAFQTSTENMNFNLEHHQQERTAQHLYALQENNVGHASQEEDNNMQINERVLHRRVDRERPLDRWI